MKFAAFRKEAIRAFLMACVDYCATNPTGVTMNTTMQKTEKILLANRRARRIRLLAFTLAGSLALTSGVVLADGQEIDYPPMSGVTETPEPTDAGAAPAIGGMGGAGTGAAPTDTEPGGEDVTMGAAGTSDTDTGAWTGQADTGVAGTEGTGRSADMGGRGSGVGRPATTGTRNDTGLGGTGTGATAPAERTTGNASGTTAGTRAEESIEATRLIGEAVRVVQRMEGDPELKELMQRAEGVFIAPDYGRAGLIIGGKGGAGVLVPKRDGAWKDPVFYNIGGINIGAQAGVATGPIAMLMMNNEALNRFRQVNNFALDADAALSIVNYSTRAQGFAGKGDVIVWSDTKGAYAGANVGLTGIRFDADRTSAFYNRKVTPQEVLDGKMTTPQANTAQMQQFRKALGS